MNIVLHIVLLNCLLYAFKKSRQCVQMEIGIAFPRIFCARIATTKWQVYSTLRLATYTSCIRILSLQRQLSFLYIKSYTTITFELQWRKRTSNWPKPRGYPMYMRNYKFLVGPLLGPPEISTNPDNHDVPELLENNDDQIGGGLPHKHCRTFWRISKKSDGWKNVST